MTTSSPSPPSLSRQAMYVEFALVCGLMWIPVLYSSIGEYMEWWKPSIASPSEIYSVYYSLAYAMLPIYLVWRNGEPLRKLGLKPFERRDGVVAIVLLLLAVALHLIYLMIKSGLRTQDHALTSVQLTHGFSLPIESMVYLAAAFREEIFYRAYLCARLRDFGINLTRTAILSALVFASVHIYQGWGLLPFHFAFGLLFAGVFLNYRSLWPLVAAHACYNLSLLALSR